MRITHIHINGEYKNLKDFKLNFDGNSFIDVFVGKNATGKSNFFEACLEIFQHIYEIDFPISFNYKIYYRIGDDEFKIEWKDGMWVDTDGNETKLPAAKFLPDNILIYYSGHNTTVKNLITSYEEKHKGIINRNRKSKTFNNEDTRRFLGIGPEYKSLLLSIMLLQRDDLNSRRILFEKLGIVSLGREVKIVFKRPDYALKNNEFTFDEIDESKRFWSAEGVFKPFLDRLWNLEKLENGQVRAEGYINNGDFEEYVLYRSLNSFQATFNDYSPFELFVAFDNLKTIGMLKDITIEVELASGKPLSINQFSDGQFQSIYIYAIAELFKDKNCITLLDEPDSFLHPEWQFDFFKQVIEISNESSESNHILMTSHSAVTLLNSQEKKINLFKFHDGKVVTYRVAKDYAISQLSSNLIKVYHDKEILKIIHEVGQNKPILFTEGYSDPIILHEAWRRLYDYDIPFEICFGHGCRYLRLLLQDQKFLAEMGAFPVFGLFDFDIAYDQWSSIARDDENLIVEDPYKGLVKKVKDKNSYALLVPVPKIPEIEKQVVKEGGKTYESGSVLELEHVFYNADTQHHFHNVTTPGGGNVIEINDSEKMTFATDVVPVMNNDYFEVFRPMFDFIVSKC